jgi:hypothetical protein
VAKGAVIADRGPLGGPRVCFVSTRRGNRFLTELLEALGEEAAAAGARVSFAFDGYPPADGDTAFVVIPHEFFAIVPPDRWPEPDELDRTLALCVEMPGTPWFDVTIAHAGRAAAALAISQSAATELRRRGVAAEHFQLGYCRAWDAWGGDAAQSRPFDVVYMGAADARRSRLLAGFADHLWSRRTSILVPPTEPKRTARPDYLTGRSKYERLRSSKVLINLHRDGASAFEWIRVLESLSNGCVVVSEHSRDHGPLVPGEHFISARAESLGLLADHLLDDPDRLDALRTSAYGFIRSQLRMDASIGRLLDMAADLTRDRGATPRPSTVRRRLTIAEPAATPETPQPPRTSRSRPRPRSAMKEMVLQNLEIRRRLQALTPRPGQWDAEGVQLLVETPAFHDARPRVTVAIPVFNQAREIGDALRSVAESLFDRYEIMVYDDGSSDASASAVERFFAAHPSVPARLYQSRSNGGPSRARNALTSRARGELIFMLDADNQIYPTTLSRLTEALDGDPEASFAYSIVATHTEGEPVGLVSALPWEPGRLAEGNYIDAMSLWRRADLVELGGYAEDPCLQGWEDYDLWCRCAQGGRHGVMLHEILGWYRRTNHATLALMDLDVAAATSLIRERSPAVFHAVAPTAPPRLITAPIPDGTRAYPATGSIAIFGAYKTGTTALFSLVRNSLPEGTRTLFEPDEYVPEPEDAERIVLAKVILAVPEEPGGVRYESFLNFDRKLYLVRDPRDWLVSGTLFSIQQDPCVYDDPRTLSSVLALLRQKEEAPQSVPLVRLLARILGANPQKSLNQTANWLARQLEWLIQFEAQLGSYCRVRYESLVDEDLSDIEAHLEIPLVGAASVDSDYAHVPRTKNYGNWRHWLTEEDVAFFRPLMSEYIERYGYDEDWRLDPRPAIAREHATDYVERAVARRQQSSDTAGSHGRWMVEPYLHVDAAAIANPITGQTLAAGIEDEAALRAVMDGRLTTPRLPDDTRQRLTAGAWLVPWEEDPWRRFTLRYVSLEAHTVCNQGCYFCPVSVARRPDYFMPSELYERIARELGAYQDTIEAVFMNNYNEPTADARLVAQVATLRSYGLPPAMLTNGSGLTPQKVDELVAIGGLRYLSVNLSTLDRDRYRHDREADHLRVVLRNLEYVQNVPLAPRMEIVVLGRGDEVHHRDFDEIRARFENTLFEVKSFEIMDRAGRLPIGLKPPLPNARLCGCDNIGSRPVEHLHITAQGTCVLCCEDYDERYVVGDLTVQSVADVLTGPELAKFRRWAYGGEDAPDDFMCRRCVFARAQ